MSRDPNGVYSLPPSYFVQTGDTILPVQHNPVFESVANALTNSIDRDGRTVMTGHLQMGGNKVTGIGDPNLPGDAMTRRVSGIEFETRSHAEAWEGTPSMPDSIVIRGDASVDDGAGGLFALGYASDNPILINGQVYGRVRDVSGDRLSEPVGALNFQKAFFGRIYGNIQYDFPDMQQIKDTYGYRFLYPQGLFIDEPANEILLGYAPNDDENPVPHNRWSWFARFNLDTFQYIGCFSAGTMFAEGMGVSYPNGVRTLTAKDSNQYTGKYDISSPLNMERLAPTSVSFTDTSGQMAYRDGTYLIEQRETPLGTLRRKYLHGKFDSDLNRTGMVDFGIISSGDNRNTPRLRTLPKAQSTALGDGFIVRGYGGLWSEGTPVEGYHGIGVRVFDNDGGKLSDGIMNPAIVREILLENGIREVTRIECEGCYVTADNRIILAVIYIGGAGIHSATEGILLLEMFSNAPDAIDFRPAAMQTPALDLGRFQAQLMRKSPGGAVYDPLTGDPLSTVWDVVDLMRDLDLGHLSWYTSTANIIGPDGETPPNACIARVYNGNNTTLFYEVEGTNYYINKSLVPASQTTNQGMVEKNTVPPSASERSHITIGVPGNPEIIFGKAGTDTRAALRFRNGNGEQGSIFVSATGITVNGTSDQSLKEDKGEIVPDAALEIMRLITWHSFLWRSTGLEDWGVFAQELHEVYPRAVTPGGWFVNTETGYMEPAQEGDVGAYYIPWQVDATKLIPVIGRCLQVMMDRQDDMEVRISALEVRL